MKWNVYIFDIDTENSQTLTYLISFLFFLNVAAQTTVKDLTQSGQTATI